VAAALTAVLESVTSSGPGVIVVDDLQWLDHASASAIAFALRHVADRPILFAFASRPVAIPIDLARLGGDDLTVIEPTPLSLTGSRVLLAGAGVQLGRVDLVRVQEATGGNPLHVTETARLLRAGVAIGDALLPASLRDIIDADLRRLPDEHVDVLAAAALMPQPHVGFLVRLFDEERVERALSAAESLEVLRVGERNDLIVFRHPLLRSGLVDRLTTIERRRLHRRCAELDLPTAVRAFHLGASMSGTDPATADLLERAAGDASDRGLPDAALAHAEAALAATDPGDHATRRRRAVMTASLALDAGEPRRSDEMIGPWLAELDALAAAGEPLPDDAIEVLITAAVSSAHVRGARTAPPLFERALELAPLGSVERAKAASNLALALLYTDVDRSSTFAAQALADARASGDELLEQELTASLDVALVLAGRPIEPTADDPADAASMSILVDRLSVAVWTDDHARAETTLAEAWRRIATTAQTATHEHNVLLQASDLRTRQGRLDEAADLADRAWLLAEDVESGIGRSCDIIVIALLRGDHDAVDRHLALLDDVPIGQEPIVLAQIRHAQGVAALANGDVTGAVAHLRAAAGAFDEAGVFEVGSIPVGARLIEALVLADHIDEAEQVAVELAARAERSGRRRAAAEAARALGSVRAAKGELAAAAQLVDEALAGFDAIGLPLERVQTQLLAASIARRQRRRGDARSALDDAKVEAMRCGAHGMVPRIDAELERLGTRVADGELTLTERQIVELVVRGRSNAEVAAELHLSVRTVESNLTRIYRKQGVRSRSELISRQIKR
jgi:DNA-binding CsgD family transcriptional regulator/tetratricopeptide (TPR) repeat protein